MINITQYTIMQIFNESITKGIQFYREYVKLNSLKNSHEIQKFTEQINILFDILNHKYLAEGIKKSSSDLKVW